MVIAVVSPAPTTGNLMYLTKRLEQAIRSLLDDRLREHGLTSLQYTALAELALRDGVSGARLARDSFVTPQSMAEMLRLMQDRGYIRRVRNERNRREYLVRITPAGRKLVDRLEPEVRELEARMVEGLTSPQAELFRRALQSAGAALRAT